MPTPTLQRRHNDAHLDEIEAQLGIIRVRLKGVEAQLNRHLEASNTRQGEVMDALRRARLEGNPALTEIRENMDTIMEFINGNGHDGAKVRFDRLERTVKFIGWVAGAIALTTIGQLVNSVLGAILK